ncbi:unnamed protein product [Leptidea sinapis]|uniref:Uncharacterized protein n=1 Tax=Leptidea sinapis TaxID=189913 RepID=A0A5E4PT00_9NEOP|nr:unnamed protein product [Leptidea sinapis]
MTTRSGSLGTTSQNDKGPRGVRGAVEASGWRGGGRESSARQLRARRSTRAGALRFRRSCGYLVCALM